MNLNIGDHVICVIEEGPDLFGRRESSEANAEFLPIMPIGSKGVVIGLWGPYHQDRENTPDIIKVMVDRKARYAFSHNLRLLQGIVASNVEWVQEAL